MRLPDVQYADFLLPTCLISLILSSGRITWGVAAKKSSHTTLSTKTRPAFLIKHIVKVWKDERHDGKNDSPALQPCPFNM